MGFLSRLLGGSSAKDDIGARQLVNLPGPGTFSLEIVGESHYQDALERLCGGRTDKGHNKTVKALLIHDNNNQHDDQAIAVFIDGELVGHLERKNAREFRQALRAAGHPGANATCAARIVGGWDRGTRGKGHFGVKLDLPITDD